MRNEMLCLDFVFTFTSRENEQTKLNDIYFVQFRSFTKRTKLNEINIV